MESHFVSDLHLQPGNCRLTRTFLDYLRELRPDTVSRLVILGDFFHTWYHDSPVLRESYREVLEGLEQTVRRGIPILFSPGNRDFLFGRGNDRARFEYLDIHPGPIHLNLGPRRLYASHGDELCVLDLPYMRWRKLCRSRTALFLFGLVPERIKARFVRRLSEKSRERGETRDDSATRIPEAVYEKILRNGSNTIIHGHVHREEIHDFPGLGGFVRTLSDWDSKPNVLIYREEYDDFVVKSLYYEGK